MKKTVSFALCLCLAACAADLRAADWRTVKGTYAVTASNYLDPLPNEPADSHLRLQLSGNAARDLYRAMKVAAKPDECTGALAKKIGGMTCLSYKSERGYRCSFSIDIARQTVGHGVAC